MYHGCPCLAILVSCVLSCSQVLGNIRMFKSWGSRYTCVFFGPMCWAGVGSPQERHHSLPSVYLGCIRPIVSYRTKYTSYKIVDTSMTCILNNTNQYRHVSAYIQVIFRTCARTPRCFQTEQNVAVVIYRHMGLTSCVEFVTFLLLEFFV